MAKKKSAAQLTREINAALAAGHWAASSDDVIDRLKSMGVDRSQIELVKDHFRDGDWRAAIGLAQDLGWKRRKSPANLR